VLFLSFVSKVLFVSEPRVHGHYVRIGLDHPAGVYAWWTG
jgi:hypothetical protein